LCFVLGITPEKNAMQRMMRSSLVLLVAAIATAGGAWAKPFTPTDDAVVLERLPEKTDPSLKELRRMRAALAANPADLENAARVARRSIEAVRATGDPRFLGQAQAALSPWWMAVDPPAQALLLRATLKQSQHHFPGALADLDRLLARRPADGQALLTRATIFTVQGRYAEAQRDCAKLLRAASGLVTTACLAGASSLNGNAADAYRGLSDALARPGEATGVRVWALTLAAEIAARRGEVAAADGHFREALALDADDAYLQGAYADFLLDQGRARDVVPLLAARTKNDALLLRLALAEQALPERRSDFIAHRQELVDRFAAAMQRSDTLHRREEARFRLEIENDGTAALALAKENWTVQREPADLRILAAAARASGDSAARKTVADWMATTRIEDVGVASLAGGSAQ
jgi:tetratricopeptide (TPR) repeat protein